MHFGGAFFSVSQGHHEFCNKDGHIFILSTRENACVQCIFASQMPGCSPNGQGRSRWKIGCCDFGLRNSDFPTYNKVVKKLTVACNRQPLILWGWVHKKNAFTFKVCSAPCTAWEKWTCKFQYATLYGQYTHKHTHRGLLVLRSRLYLRKVYNFCSQRKQDFFTLGKGGHKETVCV